MCITIKNMQLRYFPNCQRVMPKHLISPNQFKHDPFHFIFKCMRVDILTLYAYYCRTTNEEVLYILHMRDSCAETRSDRILTSAVARLVNIHVDANMIWRDLPTPVPVHHSAASFLVR